MSTGGAIALLITWLGTLIGAVVAIFSLRHSVAKEHANRRIALENYAEAIGRWIRRLRTYLLGEMKRGIDCPHCGGHIPGAIDESQIDMSYFIEPPTPKYNGE